MVEVESEQPGHTNFGWVDLWGYSPEFNAEAKTFDLGWDGDVATCTPDRAEGFNTHCNRESMKVQLFYF